MLEKSIHNRAFVELVKSTCDVMRIAVDGFEDVIQTFYEKDIQKFENVPLKPNRKIAHALLEYLNLENKQAKEIIKTLCEDKLQRYFDWIEIYCKKHKSTRGLVLRKLLKGEI